MCWILLTCGDMTWSWLAPTKTLVFSKLNLSKPPRTTGYHSWSSILLKFKRISTDLNASNADVEPCVRRASTRMTCDNWRCINIRHQSQQNVDFKKEHHDQVCSINRHKLNVWFISPAGAWPSFKRLGRQKQVQESARLILWSGQYRTIGYSIIKIIRKNWFSLVQGAESWCIDSTDVVDCIFTVVGHVIHHLISLCLSKRPRTSHWAWFDTSTPITLFLVSIEELGCPRAVSTVQDGGKSASRSSQFHLVHS
jgi:hypothetical protein